MMMQFVQSIYIYPFGRNLDEIQLIYQVPCVVMDYYQRVVSSSYMKYCINDILDYINKVLHSHNYDHHLI